MSKFQGIMDRLQLLGPEPERPSKKGNKGNITKAIKFQDKVASRAAAKARLQKKRKKRELVGVEENYISKLDAIFS